MKKNGKKLALLVMAAMLSTSVVACGDDSKEAATVAETTATAETTKAAETTAAETTAAEKEVSGEALTEEEYLEKVQEISQTMTDTMMKSQTELSAIDPTDIEGAKKLIEDMKAPFVEFASIVAPEKYQEAQAKYKSGCEAMVEYMDLCLEMVNMGTKTPTPEETKELTDKLTTILTTVQTDLTEASTLMMEASGMELPAESEAPKN